MRLQLPAFKGLYITLSEHYYGIIYYLDTTMRHITIRIMKKQNTILYQLNVLKFSINVV